MLNKQQILEKAIMALKSEDFTLRYQTLEALTRELNTLNACTGRKASAGAFVKICYETFDDLKNNHRDGLAGVMQAGEMGAVITNTHYILTPYDDEIVKDLPQAKSPVKPESILQIITTAAATENIGHTVVINKKAFLSACRMHKKAELLKIDLRYFSIKYLKRFFKASSTLEIHIAKKQYQPAFIIADTFEAVLTECRHQDADGDLVLVWDIEEDKQNV
ncbi:MAG: hypothetical protein DBY32_11395 [Phascolarctobacterium sp.]|nr:MAG: hypothetical protein DBY32_11395 [Phascolarctobacterium sp.]